MAFELATHVLFDMDGVLLDTEPIYTQAIHAVTSKYGKAFGWGLKEQIMGRGRKAAADFLVSTLELPVTPEAFLIERDAVLYELLAHTPAISGAEAFTRKLHAAGIKMAVASSTERPVFELKIKAHQEWFSIFDAVILGDDPRLKHPKPAPDIFQIAAATLGAQASQCLVVEDAPAGVQAGLAAGMRVVAIPDANLDPALLNGAHHILSGYDQFPLSLLGL